MCANRSGHGAKEALEQQKEGSACTQACMYVNTQMHMHTCTHTLTQKHTCTRLTASLGRFPFPAHLWINRWGYEWRVMGMHETTTLNDVAGICMGTENSCWPWIKKVNCKWYESQYKLLRIGKSTNDRVHRHTRTHTHTHTQTSYNCSPPHLPYKP